MSLGRILLAALLVLAVCASSAVVAHQPPSIRLHEASSFDEMPLAALLDPSQTCSTCQAVIAQAYEVSQNTSELATLLTDLQADCAANFNGTSVLLCDLLVGAAVKELPKLPTKLYKGGYYTAAILCSVLGQCSVPCCTDNTPTQIHLSATSGGASAFSQMVVTWVTADDTADVNVQYGVSESSLASSVTATTTSYTAGGWIGAINTATMTGLQPGTEYFYRVGGDNSGWSNVTSFTTFAAVLPANFSFIVFGDMGSGQYSFLPDWDGGSCCLALQADAHACVFFLQN
jgi:hypothetical protein